MNNPLRQVFLGLILTALIGPAFGQITFPKFDVAESADRPLDAELASVGKKLRSSYQRTLGEIQTSFLLVVLEEVDFSYVDRLDIPPHRNTTLRVIVVVLPEEGDLGSARGFVYSETLMGNFDSALDSAELLELNDLAARGDSFVWAMSMFDGNLEYRWLSQGAPTISTPYVARARLRDSWRPLLDYVRASGQQCLLIDRRSAPTSVSREHAGCGFRTVPGVRGSRAGRR